MPVESKTGSKKRRYPRVHLPKGMPVAWQAGGERVVSRVGTISVGGIFIRTPHPPETGTIVKMIFELPGGVVRARAVVRYSEPAVGMGVEFTGMGSEARARLHQTLKRLIR
jgi:PilZ domain